MEKKTFNPSEHLTQIKSRNSTSDYLPVKWRLVWYREDHPNGIIDTQEMDIDLDREVEIETYTWSNEKRRSEKVTRKAKGYARFKAIITNEEGGRATGTKSENAANFQDYIEKAETGAIGRALAALGYGTQFTDQEFSEGERIVDAPVERNSSSQPPAQNTNAGETATALESQEDAANAPITAQQISSIRKLCMHLEKKEPEGLESAKYLEAKKIIQKLTAEYKEARTAGTVKSL